MTACVTDRATGPSVANRSRVLAAVLEVLYHAWQMSSSVTAGQLRDRVVCELPLVADSEVDEAVATLEYRGVAEQDSAGRWRCAAPPVALGVVRSPCAVARCLRPAGHRHGHLPAGPRLPVANGMAASREGQV